jgi:hypothetical protein
MAMVEFPKEYRILNSRARIEPPKWTGAARRLLETI